MTIPTGVQDAVWDLLDQWSRLPAAQKEVALCLPQARRFGVGGSPWSCVGCGRRPP